METLKEFNNRPFVTPLSVGHVALEHVTSSYISFVGKTGFFKLEGESEYVAPESEAISFYLKNHVMALINQRFHVNEPLEEPYICLLHDYHRTMQVKFLRAFFYVLLICTREARHAKKKTAVEKDYPDLFSWFCEIPHNHTEAISYLINGKKPDVTLSRYVKFLCDVFSKCSWSGGYGGKAWNKVATSLKYFADGEISPEMFIDTVWTLSHNNGPIFNKGILYSCQHNKALLKILDVQRSGQIPNLVSEAYGNDKFILDEHTEYLKLTKSLFPELGGSIDWDLVKSLGAVGSYPTTTDAVTDPTYGKTKTKTYKYPPTISNETLVIKTGTSVKLVKMDRAGA